MERQRDNKLYSKYSIQAHSLHAHFSGVPTFPRQIVFVLGTGTPRYRHKKQPYVPVTNFGVTDFWEGVNCFKRSFESFSGAKHLLTETWSTFSSQASDSTSKLGVWARNSKIVAFAKKKTQKKNNPKKPQKKPKKKTQKKPGKKTQK